MANNYEYDEIDLDGPAFRLLRLHAGDSEELSCDLFQAVLHRRDELIPYAALSYTWGSKSSHDRILVNGQSMSITANLYLALRSLRYPDDDRILWVDAICINQRNVKERNHQVAQMSQIYTQASRVIFFLGNATLATDVFMHCMQLIQLECSKYAYRSWTRDDFRWKKIWAIVQGKAQAFDDLPRDGLKSLLSRPWFHRVWILQEVANAKSAIVCCGNQTIAANIFAIAPIIFGVEPSVHCQSVIDIMPGPWRQTSWWSEKPCLYSLLLRFGETEASEPRDLIYALKAIASDADSDSPVLTPDYSKTESRLCCDVLGFLLGFQCGEDLLRSVCVSIKDLIGRLEQIKNRVLQEAVRAADIERLEGIIRAPGVNIPEDIIENVAEYDMTGEMMNSLFGCHKDFAVAVNTFLKVVEMGTVPAITALEYHISNQGTIPALDEKLVAAARNRRQGSSLMEHFLSDSPKLDDYTRVAETAAANGAHAINIIQQLLHRGYHIVITHQLHSNALTSGYYKDILVLFVKGPLSDKHMLDNMSKTGANENSKHAETVITFFRSQAKFLIRCSRSDAQPLTVFELSHQLLRSYGYIILEELFLCAAEVFAESTSVQLLRQRNRFNLAVSRALINGGDGIQLTKNVVQTAIDGDFEEKVFRLLTEARGLIIGNEDALAIVKLGHFPSVEMILLHQEGLFRRNAAIVGAFQDWYIANEKQRKEGWLHHAFRCKCFEVFKLLLSFGADMEQKDSLGRNALCAIISYRASLPHFNNSACLNSFGRETTVHRITSSKSYYLEELLLVCGADVNAANFYGHTSLDEAARVRDKSLTEMLRDYGAYKTICWTETLPQESPSPVTVSISETVKELMEELDLVARPNGWLLDDNCKHLELSPKERRAKMKGTVDDV